MREMDEVWGVRCEVGCLPGELRCFSRFLVVFAEIYWANTRLFGRRVIRTNCCLLVLAWYYSVGSLQFKIANWQGPTRLLKLFQNTTLWEEEKTKWFYYKRMLNSFKINIKIQKLCRVETDFQHISSTSPSNFVPLKFYNFILIYCTKIFKQ